MAAEEKSKKGGKAKKGAEKSKSIVKSIEVEPLKVLSEPAVEPSLPKKAPTAASVAPAKKPITKSSEPIANAPATVAPIVVAKPAAPKKSAPKKKEEVILTSEQIQLRAYFIAERRKNLGVAGDATGDWVQAEEELRAEAAGK
jgi:hypothetical protein